MKSHGKGLEPYIVRTLAECLHGKIEGRVPGNSSNGAKFVIILTVVEKKLVFIFTME
jgi:hypothetical protein